MKRAIILGPYGAGKSTFARNLHDKTEIPLYFLDNIWFLPNESHIDPFVFESRVYALMQQDRWIIEGNYLSSIEARMARCDTIFLLDIPPNVCVEGLKARAGKKTESRPFIEKPDAGIIAATRRFRENAMPNIYDLIRRYGRNREVHIFHSRREADDFLQNL